MRDATTLAVVDDRLIDEYMVAFGLSGNLTEPERAQFREVAKAYQLNPFKREVYCTAYGKGNKRKLSIIVGYEVYLKRAERQGRLDGWRAWVEGECKIEERKIQRQGENGPYEQKIKFPVGNLRAIVEIHRRDWGQVFHHEVYLEEYAQENEMWGAKPRTMLKKVAIAQAFRMCFPDEMGGLPYIAEELPPEMVIAEKVIPAVEPAAPVAVLKEKIEEEKTEEENIVDEIVALKRRWVAGVCAEENGETVYTLDEQAELKKIGKTLHATKEGLPHLLDEVVKLEALVKSKKVVEQKPTEPEQLEIF